MSAKSNKLTKLKVNSILTYYMCFFYIRIYNFKKVNNFFNFLQKKAITNFKDLEQGVFYKIGIFKHFKFKILINFILKLNTIFFILTIMIHALSGKDGSFYGVSFLKLFCLLFSFFN
jgi:hypothetical protein